jgi:hypothetical protein
MHVVSVQSQQAAVFTAFGQEDLGMVFWHSHGVCVPEGSVEGDRVG